MSQKVLITGATGFIGSHLVKACIEKGCRVSAFVLEDDPEQNRIEKMGANIITGDLRNEASVRNAAKGINVIFHCAGLVTDWAPKSLFRDVILTGTENVCKAAHQEHVDRLVYISTNDVFGRIEGKEINEFFPLKKWGEPYPDFKIEAEKTVWYYHNELGVASSVVYPCWVYGPEDRTFVPLLADAILKKEMLFWRENIVVWPTYIDNLIDLMLLLAEDNSAVGSGYLVHDGESTSLQEFCGKIAEHLEAKKPKLHIPYKLAYAVAVMMEFFWKVLRLKNRPLLTTYAVKNLGSRFRYSIDRAKQELNWEPKVSFEEGFQRTMDWLQTVDKEDLKTEMKDFRDKNIFITGGSSGIGFAAAQKFAALGANLLLIARNLEKLEKAKQSISAEKVETLSLDISDNAEVQKQLTETCHTFGAPDVLMNCAGYAIPRKFEDIEFEQFDSIVKTNLYGTWNTTQTLIRHLKERKGYIINVSSIAGFIGVFGYSDYCASKFGVIGLSETLREEYAQHGVKVSVLCPPDTDTPAFEHENKTKPEETKAISESAKLMQPDQVADVLIKRMKKEQFLIIPGFDGKIAQMAKRFSPNLVHWMMQRDIKKPNRK